MTTAQATRDREPVLSLVPARMDRLPWTRFHWLIIVGLGVSWILDGLEAQIVAANGYAQTLHMNTVEVTAAGTVYLAGQVLGALVFGRLSDRLGRRRLFILTLFIYLVGSGLAGFAGIVFNADSGFWATFWIVFFYACRFIAGTGIGGEYAAINSAIDELIPANYRGRVDIIVNGTYWAGAALGAAASILILNPDIFSGFWGWRLGFFIGPVLGLIIIYIRRTIPESPRWLMTHGREQEAEDTVADIERDIEASGRTLEPVDRSRAINIRPIDRVGPVAIFKVLIADYPNRTLTAAVMMITQSFLYNAIFFTYALVLGNFYGVPKDQTGYYFFPFAIGNLVGPLVLGHLFDVWGRRKMILLTYGVAGAVLAVSAGLFAAGALTALTQTIFWCVAFFFASAGASSGYLTMSELFPLELRSQAISYFFSIGQIAGAVSPIIYGILIGDGSSRVPLTYGYFIGAFIMIAGGVVAWIFGVDAERKSLETVTSPLSLVKQVEAVQRGDETSLTEKRTSRWRS